MSAFPTDILIEKKGGRETLENAAYNAKVILAKTILKKIANRSHGEISIMSVEDMVSLTDTLGLIEMRCIDLSNQWRRDSKSDQGIEFRDYCSLAFDIRRVLHPSDIYIEQIKDVLLISAVGVLGDRSADVKRYLSENLWPIKSMEAETEWPILVLVSVADAFLRIIRKKDWNDLYRVASLIDTLRQKQLEYEKEYLTRENGLRQVAAMELVAFYHLAKAVEMLGVFVGKGTPQTALDDIDFHFSKSIEAADEAGIIELGLLLRWLSMATRVMIRSTVWHQLSAYNSKITAFKEILTSESQTRPLFELLPPQRDAIQDVMHIGNRAVVVEMPTSSGKTLLAEFRIIQTKVNISNSWIAYLVPTRALVNQITVRLRRDLSGLGFVIEQATPAYEIDPLEEELLSVSNQFDILVTTPEKLDLLIRNEAITKDNRTLGLVILDEAHNLGDGARGLRSELVLATINRESPNTHFLLLTPFVPNANELATWLDDERSKCVTPSLAVNWQPNDRMIALAYPNGRGRVWGLELKPLHVTRKNRTPISFNERIPLTNKRQRSIRKSDINSNVYVAALVAEVLANRGNSIILTYSPTDCWRLSEKLAGLLPNRKSEKISLVKEYIKLECGADFALYSLLDKGIGVHHAGISPDIRSLMEWLTEEGDLCVLVATTTLAQGVNFPISNVILSTYFKPRKAGVSYIREKMRSDEFWNIAGRAGRLFQDTLGLVIFAINQSDNPGIESYVNENVVELASALEQMINEAIEKGWELDLKRLVRNDPKWSSFVQYLAHCYRKAGDHSRFLTDTEKLLKRTYAYHRLSVHQPEIAKQLVNSTRVYAEQLKGLQPGVLTLVDSTGFSPETILDLLKEKDSFSLTAEEWSPSNLFRVGGDGIKDIVGALLKVREIDLPEIIGGSRTKISSMIQMWVSGKSLREIADMHFNNIEDIEKRITDCCRLVYQTLTHQGSWGVGALQSMNKIDTGDLSPEAKSQILSVPAMIYYGVPTVDAVIMRNLGVPRSISVRMGEYFKSEEDSSDSSPRLQKARKWLEQSTPDQWAAAGNGIMSGEKLKEVWRIISGSIT